MKSSEEKLAIEKEKIESEKEKYVEKRKAQIDKWNVELDELDAKIAAADADNKAKLEHKEKIAALRGKRDEARERLAEIQSAGDDRWESLRDGMENIWTGIKNGFSDVKAKF